MRSTSFQSVSFPREWSTRGQPGAGANHCSRQRSNGGSPAGPAQLRELGGALGAAHSRGSPAWRGWTAERRRHSLSPRPFAHLQRARRGRGLLWPAPERSQRSAFAAPPRLRGHHRFLGIDRLGVAPSFLPARRGGAGGLGSFGAARFSRSVSPPLVVTALSRADAVPVVGRTDEEPARCVVLPIARAARLGYLRATAGGRHRAAGHIAPGARAREAKQNGGGTATGAGDYFGPPR